MRIVGTTRELSPITLIYAMLTLMNEYRRRKIPYLFIIDFDLANPVIIPLKEAESEGIFFCINGMANIKTSSNYKVKVQLTKEPVDFKIYDNAFKKVQQHLLNGNTYLTNLTFETPVQMNIDMRELFIRSRARFKLLYKDKFVVFSPESFISIIGNEIATFPMKGTIDESVENASEVILHDRKEMAEHATITDLLRNDLSIIASDVRVERYRYIERLVTNNKSLLQVSSEIRGKLSDEMLEKPGDIFRALLPAGSISGAPKKKTVEIIKEVENHERGYYTGVFGYDNGIRIESGVMIRYIEQRDGRFYYKSGGGITSMSNAHSEYNEMIDKVYLVPG